MLWSREHESREVFLSSSCALVIELFIVALIFVLGFQAIPPFFQCCAVILLAIISSSLLDFPDTMAC